MASAYLADADFVYPATGTIVADWDTSRNGSYHEAIDVANQMYTDVIASRGGYHTRHWASGCGNYSVIDHGSGYETCYCHLDSWVAGDGVNVSGCQHVAEMGSTGYATSPHVHYEIRYDGDPAFVPGETDSFVCGCVGVPRDYFDDSGGLL